MYFTPEVTPAEFKKDMQHTFFIWGHLDLHKIKLHNFFGFCLYVINSFTFEYIVESDFLKMFIVGLIENKKNKTIYSNYYNILSAILLKRFYNKNIKEYYRILLRHSIRVLYDNDFKLITDTNGFIDINHSVYLIDFLRAFIYKKYNLGILFKNCSLDTITIIKQLKTERLSFKTLIKIMFSLYYTRKYNYCEIDGIISKGSFVFITIRYNIMIKKLCNIFNDYLLKLYLTNKFEYIFKKRRIQRQLKHIL